MLLKHTISFFKKVKGLPHHVTTEWSYQNDQNETEVDTDQLEEEHIGAIYRHAQKRAEAGDKAAALVIKRIDSYRDFLADPAGKPVGRLERLETAMTEYLRPAKHKFIFVEEADGQMCPYFVRSIKYDPPDKRRESPAQVCLSAIAIAFDEEESYSKTWYTHDIVGGKTVADVLRESGIHRETEAAYEAYIKEVARFNEIVDQLGEQYSATGTAFNRSDRWGSGMLAMERDGEKSRIVIDRKGDDTEKVTERVARAASMGHWVSATERNSDEGEEKTMAVPVHPYVQAFDLGLHTFVGIHVNNIEPYAYDHAVTDKLVLPEDMKELVDVLMESSAAIMDDIVAGKTGGTVVIATGPPGTGKTLTAECYSEKIERPLYSVQCSQLGTDEEKLEKRLMRTLARASRWGAILLIDEADVYVRARGDDIQQNAIVGVFLRLLERYRGILFLTSNRSTVIDDAIISRAIAHPRYELPEPAQLTKLWKVLGDNYGVKLSPAQIKRLVTDKPNISGRNVKNILKLATIMNRKSGKSVSVETLLYVTKFIDLAE